MIDLWPNELSTVDQRSPLTILKEQASLLGEKTQIIVIAELENFTLKGPLRARKYPFKYSFMLTCPALGNYRFRLFSIAHDVSMYPVSFDLDQDVAQEIFQGELIIKDVQVEPGKDGTFRASNEEEFIEILKRIFSSRKALQVIRALLSQAKS